MLNSLLTSIGPLFHLVSHPRLYSLPPIISARVSKLLCPAFLFVHVALVWFLPTMYPCDQQYPSLAYLSSFFAVVIGARGVVGVVVGGALGLASAASSLAKSAARNAASIWLDATRVVMVVLLLVAALAKLLIANSMPVLTLVAALAAPNGPPSPVALSKRLRPVWA
jgi:hypothetical protein